MPLFLTDLPMDVLRKLFGLVDVKFPLKLACRAMREAHRDATETPLSFALQTLDHLEWARGWPCNYECTPKTVLRAARCGKDDVVHWLVRVLRVEWDVKATFTEACAGGSVDVLEFIEDVARVDKTIRAAIKPPDNDDSWQCMVAATHGHVHVLRWLRAHDHLVGRHTTLAACRGGHVHVLEELKGTRAMADRTGVVDEAASHGHANCVQWLHEHAGATVSIYAMMRAAENGHTNALKTVYALAWWPTSPTASDRRRALAHAVRGDNPDCAKFCVEVATKNVEHVDMRTIMETACVRGASKVVRWLIEDGLVTEVSPHNVIDVIRVRDMDTLDVLFELGHVPKTNPCLCEIAASSGALRTLKLLRKHGCVWRNEDEGRRKLATLVASRGHTKTFKWIMQFGGASWDQKICNALMNAGSLECLSWLLRSGCPFDWHELREYGVHTNLEVQSYVSRGDHHFEDGWVAPWEEGASLYDETPWVHS